MNNEYFTSTLSEVQTRWDRVVRRRSFLKGLGAVGAAGAAVLPAGVATATAATAKDGALSRGDVAILRFLAAAEIIESDLWMQYNELGGAGGGNPAYVLALENIDADMPQYITDNTDDELSHAAFLNAYLRAHGAPVVDLDRFRTLPGSRATGARQQTGRLTNLLALNVDTGWYTRYRSARNPDLGAAFAQAVAIRNQPAIPLNDTDTPPDTAQPVPPVTRDARRMQAIANTAAFHFAMIEQGGSSLYTTMSQKVTSLEVLRIVVSIGGVEVDHFAIWHDKVGNTVSGPLAGLTDPVTGVAFPDLNNPGGELRQTNKILPEPCEFLDDGFPACSVIRPSSVANAGAVAAVNALKDDLLFQGQPREFLETMLDLARAADAAHRQL
jgi:hypothetical protein